MDKTTKRALIMGAAGLVQGTANTYMQTKENARKDAATSKRDKALHLQALAMADIRDKSMERRHVESLDAASNNTKDLITSRETIATEDLKAKAGEKLSGQYLDGRNVPIGELAGLTPEQTARLETTEAYNAKKTAANVKAADVLLGKKTKATAGEKLSGQYLDGRNVPIGELAGLTPEQTARLETTEEYNAKIEKKTLDKTIAAEKRAFDNSILKALMAQGGMDRKEAKKIRNDAYDAIFKELNDPAKRYMHEQKNPGKTVNEIANLYVANIVKLKTGVDVSAATEKGASTGQMSVVDSVNEILNAGKKGGEADKQPLPKEVNDLRNNLFVGHTGANAVTKPIVRNSEKTGGLLSKGKKLGTESIADLARSVSRMNSSADKKYIMSNAYISDKVEKVLTAEELKKLRQGDISPEIQKKLDSLATKK